MEFQIAQKLPNIWIRLQMQNCCQDLSRVVQSGHILYVDKRQKDAGSDPAKRGGLNGSITSDPTYK